LANEKASLAIVLTDIVGFTALGQENESLALELLSFHNEMMKKAFAAYRGRVVKTIGDAFLVSFDTSQDAVSAAVEAQKALREWNLETEAERRIFIRIGIHRGDVVVKENDIFGDTVNVVSRIEPLAEPGGICLSKEVYEEIRKDFSFTLVYLGKRVLKNIKRPFSIYKIALPWDMGSKGIAGDGLPSREASMAVLPFSDLSPEADQAFFCDGLSEDIIELLVGVEGLRVVAKSSSFAFRGSDAPDLSIGRTLGVDYILSGSVRRAGSRVRLAVRLTSVLKEEEMWSDRYDRDLEDIFAVQDEISRSVVEGLREKLLETGRTSAARRHSQDGEAYERYLKGRYFCNLRDPVSLLKSQDFFRAALEIDPSYALAHVGMAESYTMIGSYNMQPPGKAFESARIAAERALDLDATQYEAHATLGYIRAFFEWDWAGAEAHFKEAIRRRSEYATAHSWYAFQLAATAASEGAVREIRTAHLLEPLSPIIDADVGLILILAGEFEAAVERLEGTLGMAANFQPAILWMGNALWLADRKEEAIQTLERATKLPGDIAAAIGWLGHCLALMGQEERARRCFAELNGISEKMHVPRYCPALIHLGLDNVDQALDDLEESARSRDMQIVFFLQYADRFLAGNSRFEQLAASTGIPREGLRYRGFK